MYFKKKSPTEGEKKEGALSSFPFVSIFKDIFKFSEPY